MRRIILFLAALLCLLPELPAQAQTPAQLTLAPQNIAIDTLYNGADLTVTGQVPADNQVVVRVSGTPTTMHMKQKGKVLGLLWMNTDKVTFAEAPSVFLVAASPETPAEQIAKLGVPSLANRITVTGKDADKAGLVAEFLKFQKTEKLYVEKAGTVTVGANADGMRPFKATLHIPSRLSPGDYAVEAFAVGATETVPAGQASIKAAFVGIPAFLADMAFNHGTLYGVLASIIAILGGLVVSMIFSGSKSGSH